MSHNGFTFEIKCSVVAYSYQFILICILKKWNSIFTIQMYSTFKRSYSYLEYMTDQTL